VIATSRSSAGFPDLTPRGLDDLSTKRHRVLACPLTPETTGRLFINVSRRPVVDDAALIDALARAGGRRRCFATQPLPADHLSASTM
jgi:phosphoglycerate dehydrogenase-like enzyme